MPQEKLAYLKRLRADWQRTHPHSRSEADWQDYAKEVTGAAQRWLDEGYGACHFRERSWCEELRQRLHSFQDQRYQLSCWAIMPNHCHAILRPWEAYALEDLIGAMKGVTARNINVALRTTGAIWEDEIYDRIIRDEEHLWRVVQYIGRNPRVAGLHHEQTWRRWIHPAWEAAGWGFRDEPD